MALSGLKTLRFFKQNYSSVSRLSSPMLSPVFFCRLEEVDDDTTGTTTIVLASSPLPPGITYKITSYAQVDSYTLVRWQQGYEEEYFTGETLYLNTTPIAITGGALQLYSVSPNQEKSEYPVSRSIWDSVDGNIGRYGLSMTVAIALRNLQNIVYL